MRDIKWIINKWTLKYSFKHATRKHPGRYVAPLLKLRNFEGRSDQSELSDGRFRLTAFECSSHYHISHKWPHRKSRSMNLVSDVSLHLELGSVLQPKTEWRSLGGCKNILVYSEFSIIKCQKRAVWRRAPSLPPYHLIWVRLLEAQNWKGRNNNTSALGKYRTKIDRRLPKRNATNMYINFSKKDAKYWFKNNFVS